MVVVIDHSRSHTTPGIVDYPCISTNEVPDAFHVFGRCQYSISFNGHGALDAVQIVDGQDGRTGDHQVSCIAEPGESGKWSKTGCGESSQ